MAEKKRKSRKKWRAKKQIRKNSHHFNPRSRIPELIRELDKKPQEFFEGLGLAKNALINKIYATKKIDIETHDAWHALFSNMFAWEAIAEIKSRASFDLMEFIIPLGKKQQLAWDLVFGRDAPPKKAIKIIKRIWWPKYPPPGRGNIFKKEKEKK